MDIVRIDNNGKRAVIKPNATKEDFFSLMKTGIKRFGLYDIKDSVYVKGSNPLGVNWKNAHKLTFTCRNMEFRFEFLGDIDLDFLKQSEK